MHLGSFSLDAEFVARLVTIILIDLALAGDNAVVIAMAARTLPRRQRRKAIVFGAGGAVLLRVTLTFFVSQLLAVPFLKLLGGLLILWVALKLLVKNEESEGPRRQAASVWEAIRLIVIADITMSLDNMLAVGGASAGNLPLLLFGLGLSIPFVVVTSDLLSRLMDRFPVIVFLGAAILGKVSAEMILTDPFTAEHVGAGWIAIRLTEAAFAAGVVLAGWLWTRRAAAKRTAT